MIKRNYKKGLRRRYLFFVLFVFVTSLTGCGKSDNDTKNFSYNEGDLCVNYLSVGASDCTIIRFPNDKILVIDTATCNVNNEEKINKRLENLKAKSIDYLILTHPDVDHYGNTLRILENYSIKNVYTPQVNSEIFTDFCSVLDVLEQNGSTVKHITMSDMICEGEVSIYFLYAKTSELNIDLEIINEDIVTIEEADNFSPIILLEYKGIRFLFEGDASVKNERKLIENYKNKLYDLSINRKIDLTNIDYFMLSSHGKNSGNSIEFLELIKPQNAIISVCGNDNGMPSFDKIDKLTNQNCRLLRSDYEGDILVCVNNNGGTKVTTEYDLNGN